MTAPRSDEPWSRALDLLRGASAVMVVTLHACVPYLAHELPGLRWLVREPAGPGALDAIFWWCYAAATPAFSLIAGVLTASSAERQPPRALAASRVKRLAVPLLISTFTILPLTYLLWLRGWQLQGLADPAHPLRGNFAPGLETSLWGFAHLWSLEYMLIFSLAAAGLLALRPAPPTNHPWSRPLLFALLALGIAAAWPWVFADYHNTFWPETPKLAYHAAFFASGWALFAHRHAWPRIPRVLPLALGALALPVLVTLASQPRGGFEPWLALAATLVTWGTILGLLALGTRASPRVIARARPLARASFMMYLLHLPLVAAAQLALRGVPIPGPLKAAAIALSVILTCQWLHARLARLRWGWLLGA